jgi:predicted nucleic acid-binding Zn finger protein
MVIQTTEVIDPETNELATKVTVLTDKFQHLNFYLENKKDDIVLENEGKFISVRKILIELLQS